MWVSLSIPPHCFVTISVVLSQKCIWYPTYHACFAASDIWTPEHTAALHKVENITQLKCQQTPHNTHPVQWHNVIRGWCKCLHQICVALILILLTYCVSSISSNGVNFATTHIWNEEILEKVARHFWIAYVTYNTSLEEMYSFLEHPVYKYGALLTLHIFSAFCYYCP
jgi:hypothetical protein